MTKGYTVGSGASSPPPSPPSPPPGLFVFPLPEAGVSVRSKRTHFAPVTKERVAVVRSGFLVKLGIMSALVGEMSVPGIMCQDVTIIRMAFTMPETKSIRSIISVQKEKYKSINLFGWRIIRMS